MERDDRRKQENQQDNAEMIARSLEAEQRDREREKTRRMNKLWIWLGVMFLVVILIWLMYFLGFLEFLS